MIISLMIHHKTLSCDLMKCMFFVSTCFEILFQELNHLHVFCVVSDPDSLGVMEMCTAQAHPQIKWIGSGCKVAKDACDPPNFLSNR